LNLAVVAVGLALSRKSLVPEWRKKSVAMLGETDANRPKTIARKVVARREAERGVFIDYPTDRQP
jgi:hypothetical protein